VLRTVTEFGENKLQRGGIFVGGGFGLFDGAGQLRAGRYGDSAIQNHRCDENGVNRRGLSLGFARDFVREADAKFGSRGDLNSEELNGEREAQERQLAGQLHFVNSTTGPVTSSSRRMTRLRDSTLSNGASKRTPTMRSTC
jgi:hypothetical protein